MFTGLVQLLARVASVEDAPPGKRLSVSAPILAADANIGDSICVSGCCLTVVANDGEQLSFEAGPETLSRTTLGLLKPGDQVNLEPSLRVGDKMGGHFVTGHVDGLGTLLERIEENDWATLRFYAPKTLTRQMASKGSIAIDGVSLTLVEVELERFSVQLIPHTLKATTLGSVQIEHHVNLETDLLAKYVGRIIADGWTVPIDEWRVAGDG